MLPIVLNLTKIPVLLTGQGELLARRVQFLQEAGATQVTVLDNPSPADIQNAAVVMVAGLPRPQAEHIAAAARAAGKLVNVEDINDLCDFYFTANVRRGDLLIAVSTSGASPTLARKLRDAIAERFGPEWAGYVGEIADFRRNLKQQKKSFPDMVAASEKFLAEKGWLTSPSPCKGEGRGGGPLHEQNAGETPTLTLPLAGGGDKVKELA